MDADMVARVLSQAPPEATDEAVRAALATTHANEADAVCLLWGETPVSQKSAINLADTVQAEWNARREVCDAMDAAMEEAMRAKRKGT
jgi:hypothetical protein